MITYEEARRKVREHLDQAEAKERENIEYRIKMHGSRETVDDALVTIVDDATITGDFGWVFFYQSERYLKTGNVNYALAGNGEIIVSRSDGSLHFTGTARSPDFYIKNFQRYGNPFGPDQDK